MLSTFSFIAALLTASAPAGHAGAPVSAAAHAPAIGETAPDFTFQSAAYRWQSLRDVLAQGDVLLVLAASDEELCALERDREALLHAGVVPVAVVARKDADVWRLAQRERLSYSVLSDPRGEILAQYGALDPASGGPRPAWFVLDHTGRVRATGAAASPPRDWNALATTALGRGGVQAASAR